MCGQYAQVFEQLRILETRQGHCADESEGGEERYYTEWIVGEQRGMKELFESHQHNLFSRYMCRRCTVLKDSLKQ